MEGRAQRNERSGLRPEPQPGQTMFPARRLRRCLAALAVDLVVQDGASWLPKAPSLQPESGAA